MSNLGRPSRCCIETINHYVSFTYDPVSTPPGQDKVVLVDFLYLITRKVECTPNCNSKDDELRDFRGKLNRIQITWKERRKHYANCTKVSSHKVLAEECSCSDAFKFKGKLYDNGFKQWRNFLKDIRSAPTSGKLKEILKRRAEKFCVFSEDHIKQCCNNKFGEIR